MKRLTLFVLLILLLSACGSTQEAISTATAEAATLVAEAWTETPTHAPTFTPTWTPTLTNTPTKTVTPTLTPTSTPTASRTSLPTATLTPTLTPTIMNTPTFTLTPLPTVTNIATPTLEPIATSDPVRWERYKPRTLKEIIAENEYSTDLPYENSIFLNYGDDYASEVSIIYTGEFRMIPEQKLLLIDTWSKTFFSDLDEEERDWLFQAELLVLEDGEGYWLPVQTQLISYMLDELEAGDVISLLIVWPGWLKDGEEIEWVFLVNTY